MTRPRISPLQLLALALALLAAAACFAQDVKDNKMGMSLDEFKTLHAGEFKGLHAAHCYTGHFHKEELFPGIEMCHMPRGDLKLADVSVRDWKAYFYKGNLYRLLYEADPTGYFNIVDVLTNLYGPPLKHAEEQDYAVPDGLGDSSGLEFQFGSGWISGNMHINLWYTETTPDIYETPTRKNCTAEFVLVTVEDQLYKAGMPHPKFNSL